MNFINTATINNIYVTNNYDKHILYEKKLLKIYIFETSD